MASTYQPLESSLFFHVSYLLIRITPEILVKSCMISFFRSELSELFQELYTLVFNATVSLVTHF